MTNLRREPGAFFFFWLISFANVLVMSMIFRTIGSVARSLFQALVPAGILMLTLTIFTCFVIPTRHMLKWCRWINYIDPLAYAFESLMVNEFRDKKFEYNVFVPNRNLSQYSNVDHRSQMCNSVGANPGQDFVLGDDYVDSTFGYEWGNRWRNFGILILFASILGCVYLACAELICEKKSKGEVLVYPRGKKPASVRVGNWGYADLEAFEQNRVGSAGVKRTHNFNQGSRLQQQTSIFHWQNVCYDIKIKKDTRRILDHVDGWVKPGTLTALMGVSGARKTTLLDSLADRLSVGVITGEMLIDGMPRDMSFQGKTGYVKQQDIHLHTSTVREVLQFSAILRQLAHISQEEKLAYVEEIISILNMGEYADTVVGVPGEGLNIKQRKRLTIAIELVAKPPLLLFFDEPTSGLDSQTSWAILDLLRKLTNVGQAVLCTIHQPSYILFQQFDRLLLMSPGGKTVYFGDIGEKCGALTHYFESNGAQHCPPNANPAEWMLDVIGDAPGTKSAIDWHKRWRESPQYIKVQAELAGMKIEKSSYGSSPRKENPGSYQEFAAPFIVQLRENLKRVFQQY
uniref:ABC transporter domain-containing protein n=1 Tax=Bionectria ochroleuca TaxID=29856 RepID=A0A8H7K3G5_BIOOC